MDKREFYYPSADGEHQIHAIAWLPEGDVKGILRERYFTDFTWHV